VGTWEKLVAEVVILLGTVFILALCSTAQADEARGKLVGMYVHQYWPYHHPFAARTWTMEDWRGHADGHQTRPEPVQPTCAAGLSVR
jgi:hypothetical protein